MFKKKRGINLTYKEQGYIYFLCQNLKEQPDSVKKQVTDLAKNVAGEDYKALLEVLANERQSVRGVSIKYYISEKRLYKYRKQFYERWNEFTKNVNRKI